MHGHASDGLFWLYLSTVVRNNVTPVGFMHSKASCDFGNVVHVTCTLSQFFFFFFSRLYFAHFYDSTLVTCGAGLHRNGSTKELTCETLLVFCHAPVNTSVDIRFIGCCQHPLYPPTFASLVNLSLSVACYYRWRTDYNSRRDVFKGREILSQYECRILLPSAYFN